jgi:hypothetical protein
MSKNNKSILFKNKFGSQLYEISKHKTSQLNGRVIVVLRGIQYCLVNSSSQPLVIGDIREHFEKNVPSVVELTTFHGDVISCLIWFHDIPRSWSFCSPSFPQIDFSVCVFEKDNFMDVRFAKKCDKYCPNFALGCFNTIQFILKFRLASLREYDIPNLWKMFVDALRKIGYFDIYDYHYFQTTVLVFFQRMFVFPEWYHINTMRELFYSFAQRLLAKNAWFLIVGDSIQPVGFPSVDLINLFSNPRNPPVSNFIDRDSGVVGVTTLHDHRNSREINFILISIRTTKVHVIGSKNSSNYSVNLSPELNNIDSRLFPPTIDDDINYGPIITRSPASIDGTAIKQGILKIGPLILIIFKIENSINVLKKLPDGRFELFNDYLFILSKIFAVGGNELFQLSNHLQHFSCVSTKDLVKGLLECGFLPIFEGNSTSDEIRQFLSDSDFGCILKWIREEFEEFPEQLRKHYFSIKCEEERESHSSLLSSPSDTIEDHYQACIQSIQEISFIRDFGSIFELLVEKLGERQDLDSEIRGILFFLKQLVEFLTIPAFLNH